MSKIVVIGGFIPGEISQIVDVLGQAFNGVEIVSRNTLEEAATYIITDLPGILVMEHSFSIQDENGNGLRNELVQKIPTLHDEDPLYAVEASMHLLTYLRHHKYYIPAIIYTRNVRSAREGVQSFFPHDRTICVIERKPYSEDELIASIKRLMKTDQ